ncbi:hypothetical protein HDV06_003180 [Boothiomyces sp. JEL0866]|nr:hypothetical protein HDV06_003180 [Boothiomyces sp. JEL0866]
MMFNASQQANIPLSERESVIREIYSKLSLLFVNPDSNLNIKRLATKFEQQIQLISFGRDSYLTNCQKYLGIIKFKIQHLILQIGHKSHANDGAANDLLASLGDMIGSTMPASESPYITPNDRNYVVYEITATIYQLFPGMYREEEDIARKIEADIFSECSNKNQYRQEILVVIGNMKKGILPSKDPLAFKDINGDDMSIDSALSQLRKMQKLFYFKGLESEYNQLIKLEYSLRSRGQLTE